MSFTQVTVSGTYVTAEGHPAAGYVILTPTAEMRQSGVGLVPPEPTTGMLDGSGHFSVAVEANDDPSTVPAGVQYTVTEVITGASPRIYDITISHSAPGGTVDLSSF